MDTPDVASTVASLQAMHDQLLQLVYSSSSVIDRASNESVLITSQNSIATLTAMGASFNAGDFSPYDDAYSAWSAWSDVAQSAGDSLASSIGLNERWTVTYFAGQVADQTVQNLKSIGLGLGGGLALLVVLVVFLELR